MNYSTIQRILLVAGITVLAVGMLTGFAGSVAAQDAISVDNSADAEVDQDQANEQVNVQNQEGAALAAASQDISVDVSDAAEQGISIT